MMKRNRHLKRLFTTAASVVLGLEIRPDEVRAALVQHTVPAQAVQAARRSLPAPLQGMDFFRDPAAAAAFLRAMLKEERLLGKATEVAIVLDDACLSTLLLDVPAMPQRELREALKWELPQHFPYEAGEYYSAALPAAFTLGAAEAQQQKVLAVAVERPLADNLLAICAQLELRLMNITVGFLALAAFTAPEETVLLLEEESSCLTLLYRGFPVSRSNLGTAGSRLGEELGAVISELQYTYELTAPRLLVSATSAAYVSALAETVRRHGLELTPQPLAFSEQLQWGGTFLTEAEAAALPALYGRAMGAAAGNRYSLPLLAHAGTSLADSALRLWRSVLAAMLAMGLLFLAYCALTYQRSTAELARAGTELQAAAHWREQYEAAQSLESKVSARENLLRRLRQENLPWSAVLTELADAAPSGCWFTAIQESKAGEAAVVSIQGRAEDMQSLHAFLENMRQCGRYAGVKLAHTEAIEHEHRELLAYTVFLYLPKEVQAAHAKTAH